MLEFKKDAVKQRIFIVGCSRSGTTLLQTLIASHPDLTTFPETTFFYNTTNSETVWKKMLKQLITSLGLATGQEVRILSDILDRLGLRYLKGQLPRQPFIYSTCVNIYLSLLDEIATKQECKKAWVEKTPKNVFAIYWILKFVPRSKVVHIVRDGREVVSSIIKRSKEYPKKFGDQDIDYAINLWNRAIKISERYANRKNNYVIKYEDLVRNTAIKLTEMGEFLDLDYASVNTKDRTDTYKKSIEKAEPWKRNVKEAIKNKNNKFNKMFTADQRNNISQKLTDNIFYDFN